MKISRTELSKKIARDYRIEHNFRKTLLKLIAETQEKDIPIVIRTADKNWVRYYTIQRTRGLLYSTRELFSVLEYGVFEKRPREKILTKLVIKALKSKDSEIAIFVQDIHKMDKAV